MKILQINKFLYPRGGAETYLFNLSKLLTKNGHQVIFFSQKNKKNIPNGQEKYFINNLELGKFNSKMIFQLSRIFWSFKAARKIKKLIAQEKPDLVHLHNIYHQLSPSILPVIKRAGLPIVMTVHDFKLIKPDYILRADSSKKRHKNSFLADWLIKLEFNFHRLIKIYQKNIDLFIAPSEFVKNKLVESGFNSEKIVVLPHFIDFKQYDKTALTGLGNYILYFGRLAEGKGVEVLIRAFHLLLIALPALPVRPLAEGGATSDSESRGWEIPKLKIAGSGPAESSLKQLIQELNLTGEVEFLGKKSQDELEPLIQNSLFTVFPSRFHETFGLGILESYGWGKPVIATNVGAFGEIVKNGETGIMIESNNHQQLKEAMGYLVSQPKKIKMMGDSAGELAKIKYDPEIHYQKLIAIYQKLVKKFTLTESN